MTDEQLADPTWDQENNFSWNAYFTDRRERELHDYTGPPPAPKRNNSEGRKRWWGVPGRSLAYVLGYIEDGNEPRLQDPPRTAPRSSRMDAEEDVRVVFLLLRRLPFRRLGAADTARQHQGRAGGRAAAAMLLPRHRHHEA